MGKTNKDRDRWERLENARQSGGLMLAGAGRAGAHADRKNPSAKRQRQDWRKQLNRNDWDM